MRTILSIIVIIVAALTGQARSIFSESRVVKLRIDSTGIYELTHAELAALGFDNPSKVKVYGYGVDCLYTHDLKSAPEGLPQMMSKHVADKLVFFAAASVTPLFEADSSERGGWVMKRRRNPASNAGFCFLSDSESDDEPAVTRIAAPDNADAPVTDTHLSYFFEEEEKLNPGWGGTRFFWSDLLWEQAPVCRFTLADRADNNVGVQTVSGICNRSVASGNYLRGVILNADTQTLASGVVESAGRCRTAYETYRTGRQMTVASVNDSQLTLTVDYPNGVKNSNWELCAVDHITVGYCRNNTVTSRGALEMILLSSRASSNVKLLNADSQTQVWETDGSRIVRTYDIDSQGCFSVGDSSETLRIFAFNPAVEQLHPSVVDVAVSGSGISTLATPDMLIVTSSVMRPYADELAELHRRFQGYEVAVVNQSDIFNEYSSGTPHVMAVRRFVSELESRSPGKLKGLLLYGPATVDQRLKLDDDCLYVITSENEDEAGSAQSPSLSLLSVSGNNDITRSFATDTYFVRTGSVTVSPSQATSPYISVMYSPMTMIVGRIPASSPTEAEAYNRKARHYLENPPLVAACNNALFASGFASRTEEMHMIDSEESINQAVEARGNSLTIRRAAHNLFGTGVNDSKALFNFIGSSLRSGVSYFSYYGHGNSDGLTGTWLANNAAKTRYENALPLGFFASCHVGAFDLNSGCFYGNMLFNENGGVIAMAASGREVYQTLNSVLGRSFTAAHFSRPGDATLGYAYLISQNEVCNTADRDLICNSLDYVFLGDPMLPAYGVDREIEVNAPEVLKPNTKNAFSGTVLKPDGTTDTDFNGVVKIAVYESPYVTANLAPALSGTQQQHPSTIERAEMDCELMTEIVGKVKNGRFEINDFIPAPVRDGVMHRVSAYAYTTDGSVRASGAAGSVMMEEPEKAESLLMPGPSISDVVIDAFNASDFRVTGAVVSATGLLTGRTFDSPIKIELDGRILTDASGSVVADAQGEYRLNYVVKSPSEGVHNLRLTVTDRLLNQASFETEFEVSKLMECELIAETSDTETGFECDKSSSGAVVVIENHSGDKLLEISLDSTGRGVWNHKLADGTDVAEGHYRAYAKVPAVNGMWWSRPVNIAVNKRP